MMFKFRKVSSHIHYQPVTVLETAFQSNDIFKLFCTPGHLFMQKDIQTLQVFDAFPVDAKTSTVCKPFTFFLSGVSPIIHVHVLRANWNVAFIFHEDGDVEIWKHITGSHSWSKVHQFSICKTKGATISRVVILEERNQVVWLEKNPDPEDDCSNSVNIRSLEKGGKDITNIGPVQTLLSNCPEVDFYEINDRIYIWPSNSGPPGLFLVLYLNGIGGKFSIRTYILAKKVSDNRQEQSIDFKVVARNLIHIWSQVNSCRVISKLINEIDKELLIVHSDGKVDILGKESKITRTIWLKNYQYFKQELFVVFRNRLVAVDQSRIRMYCLKSGNVTQEIDMHSLGDSDIHMWRGFGPVPSIGVWSCKGMWELQMTDVDKLQDSCQLEEFGQDRLASNVALKQMLVVDKSGDMNTMSTTTELLKPEMFQNPAILLALLQQNKEGSKPDAVVNEQERLCSLFSDNKLESDLSESMDSLLSQFKDLNTQYSQLMSFKQEEGKSSPSFLYDEVLFLLQDSSILSIDYKYHQMEVLAQNYPCKVLDILLRYLQLGRFANGQWFLQTADEVEQEKAIQYLNDVFGSTTVTMSSTSFPLFSFICKLIFIECPHILINFIHLVQKLKNSDTASSAFFRRSNSLQLWHQIRSGLPHLHRSRRISDAARAKADLIILSEDTNCEVEALKVLIHQKLWADALHLLHNYTGTEHHKELFVILVNSITKDKAAFKEYCTSLWDCIPDSFRLTDVLRIFHLHAKQFHHANNTEEVFIDAPDDLPVSCVKGQVLKMFLNESISD
ncbi:uncharacterized protein [Antedon mediterranea]|uniref:uncharacterized protein n=1 Tax=Antedon mediterranea TaxID=105859 RepID=UPI003AF41CA7